MNPFSSPESAARDAVELLDYLIKHHRNGFVYRGQTREYSLPLIPSAYRAKLPTRAAVYDTRSPEYQYSMRKIGKKFIQVRRFKNFADIFLVYSGEGAIPNLRELELVRHLAHDQATAEAISMRGFESALESVLSPRQLRKYRHRLSTWKKVLDRHHRALIRLNGCNEFLGFALGQTLGQHYVENSEYLDVSTSPNIAVFFATHEGPCCCRSVRQSPEPGIIYRFITNELDSENREFNYYTAPPFVDALKIVKRIEAPSRINGQWNPRDFVIFFLLGGGTRYWELLLLNLNIASDSRIGRQCAGFLVPDELHIEKVDDIGRQYVDFQAVEDLAERHGTQKFYFRHAGVDLVDADLSSDRLWPACGASELNLLNLLSCIILSRKVLTQEAIARGKSLIRFDDSELWIPPRPELLETGLGESPNQTAPADQKASLSGR